VFGCVMAGAKARGVICARGVGGGVCMHCCLDMWLAADAQQITKLSNSLASSMSTLSVFTMCDVAVTSQLLSSCRSRHPMSGLTQGNEKAYDLCLSV